MQNLLHWQALSGARPEQCTVVYGGDQSLQASAGRLVGWRDWNGGLPTDH